MFDQNDLTPRDANQDHPDEGLLNELFDHALPADEEARVLEHVYACAACQARFDALKHLSFQLDALHAITPSRDLSPAILNAIRNATSQQASAPFSHTTWLILVVQGLVALVLGWFSWSWIELQVSYVNLWQGIDIGEAFLEQVQRSLHALQVFVVEVVVVRWLTTWQEVFSFASMPGDLLSDLSLLTWLLLLLVSWLGWMGSLRWLGRTATEL